MNNKYLMPASLILLGACLMPALPARANVVQQESLSLSGGFSAVGFIKGTQIFSDSFDITTPGTLQVTLTSIPWLDTLQDLNCFLTSPAGGLLGAAINGTSESMAVAPGTVYVNWYGEAAGSYGLGVYGINVDFQPAVPVPAPAALPLLLSGLGALAFWRRRRARPAC